jgi:hypothetical protein
MFLVQFLLSVLFVVIYDRISIDLFGISSVKARFRDRWQMEQKNRISKFLVLAFGFCFFTIVFYPSTALLCLRYEGDTGFNRRDTVLIVASVFLSTVYWSCVGKLIIVGLGAL